MHSSIIFCLYLGVSIFWLFGAPSLPLKYSRWSTASPSPSFSTYILWLLTVYTGQTDGALWRQWFQKQGAEQREKKDSRGPGTDQPCNRAGEKGGFWRDVPGKVPVILEWRAQRSLGESLLSRVGKRGDDMSPFRKAQAVFTTKTDGNVVHNCLELRS